MGSKCDCCDWVDKIQPPYRQNILTGTITASAINIKDTGVKHDDGKIRWSLVIMKYLEGMIRVLMFGAKKYSPNNWMRVEDAETRYYEAAIRHLSAMVKSDGTLDINAVDEESRMPHLWHLQCNAYFLEYFRKNNHE